MFAVHLIYLSRQTDLICWYDVMFQQQYFSGDPVSLSTHLIHRVDWNGCDVRMKMCGEKIYHSVIQKWWFNKMHKLHLAEMRMTVKAGADTEEDAGENNWTQSICAELWWHRWLSSDFHCLGQLDLTWQRVMRLSIGLQWNKQSSTPPKSHGREGTAKCNILKNVAWENAAHWFSIDYSIRALM